MTQPVSHGQREFGTACSPTDNHDPRAGFFGGKPSLQRQPARVKAADGFHRQGILAGATNGSSFDKSNASRRAKVAQVDMGVTVVVVTGNESWQHPRIGRKVGVADKGDADVTGRTHRQHAQHQSMRMATAYQQQITARVERDHSAGAPRARSMISSRVPRARIVPSRLAIW